MGKTRSRCEHSSLTIRNRNDLERCQKTSFRLILGPKYENYEQALKYLHMDTLDARRDKLCLQFQAPESEGNTLEPAHSKYCSENKDGVPSLLRDKSWKLANFGPHVLTNSESLASPRSRYLHTVPPR